MENELGLFFYLGHLISDPVLLCKAAGRMVLCFFFVVVFLHCFPAPLAFLHTKTPVGDLL